MSHKKAIIIVDVQSGFITPRTQEVVSNIVRRIERVTYDVYVEAIFSAPRGSIWDRQMSWTFSGGGTVSEITDLLMHANRLVIHKQTKSVFKGNSDLVGFLKLNNITEIHIVGFDTQDCVLATAYESFDLGFLTYVVKSCVGSSISRELHEQALSILEEQDMVRDEE